MKMFTKLIGPILMLLLMSAIVVGQSQQVTNTTANGKQTIAIADQQLTEGILTDQMSNPFASLTEQKTIGGTDALAAWVLPGTNAYSQNSRAPNNNWKYQRTCYLVKASEMAAAGFTAGEVFNAIGWLNLYGGNLTYTGTLDVYMFNTTDVAYNASYQTWSNIVGAFTKVSSGSSLTVPNQENSWIFNFSGGTPLTYAGNSLYIAFDFQSAEPAVASYPVAHYCDNTFASSLFGARSNTAIPTSLGTTGSAFRPATWLSSLTPNADIVKVTNIYTVEIDAHPYSVPTPISVQVFNVSGSSATFDVILTGTDGYSQTVNVTLAANTGQAVAFPNWNPAVDGNYSFTATTSVIAGETFTENNTYLIDVNVNTTEVSYSYYAGPYSYGWTFPGVGIFAEKHYMNGSGIITGAALGIGSSTTNTGNTVYGVVLDAAGVIVATSPAHVILATELGTVIAVNFAVPPVFTNADYYVGMLTTAGTVQHFPMMAVTESPIRANGFYTFASAGGTPAAATWRFILGALVAPYVACAPPTALYASNITATNTTLNWTSGSGTSQVEWGLTGFTPTGVGTPAASGVVIPTTPNTGYDFYVRDVCSGPIYSPWVSKTYWTFCEDCPGGATAEGEGQLANGSDGSGINGGCAVADPLLTSPIALGQTYCGESNTFLNNLGANARDNDYYYLNLTTPTCIYWNLNITLKGNGLYNVTLFDAGNLDCAIGAVASFTTTSGCEVLNINAVVPSGNYYVVARVATSAGNLWPYGSGPWRYVLTVNGSQVGAPNLDPDPPASITVTVPPAGSTTQNLPIGNIGTYALDYSASTTGAYSLVMGDNFDSYTAGVQLACQAPAAWTTWSNLPCDAVEDGYVSNTYAFSGANSAKIVLNNDQVKLFGDLSTGVYKISYMQYIPSTKTGYFNILSDFTFTTGGYWAIQVYFNAGGVGSLDANHAATPFTWIPDAWKKIEVIVDLDNDVAEFIYDGTSVLTWPWSVGSSAGTGPLIIDAMDIFGAVAADEQYVDDLKVELAGNDWLTLNGGLGLGGTVAVGGPTVNISLGVNAGTYPPGIYNKTINLATNEICGAGGSYTINVTMNVGYVLSGTVSYVTSAAPKPMATNTTVTLTPGPTVPTGLLGAYDIRPVANGTYALTGATTKAWGGLNSFDATLVARYLGSIVALTNLQKRAADVNLSNSISSFDGTLIKRRLGSIATPQWTAPNYVFDGPFPSTPLLIGLPVTISGGNVTQDLKTLCSGDVNNSYTPPAE